MLITCISVDFSSFSLQIIWLIFIIFHLFLYLLWLQFLRLTLLLLGNFLDLHELFKEIKETLQELSQFLTCWTICQINFTYQDPLFILLRCYTESWSDLLFFSKKHRLSFNRCSDVLIFRFCNSHLALKSSFSNAGFYWILHSHAWFFSCKPQQYWKGESVKQVDCGNGILKCQWVQSEGTSP